MMEPTVAAGESGMMGVDDGFSTSREEVESRSALSFVIARGGFAAARTILCSGFDPVSLRARVTSMESTALSILAMETDIVLSAVVFGCPSSTMAFS